MLRHYKYSTFSALGFGRVAAFGSTNIRVSALTISVVIYEFLSWFTDSRCKILARGCEFCKKLAATATFGKLDSRVRTGNVALASMPCTCSEICVFYANH